MKKLIIYGAMVLYSIFGGKSLAQEIRLNPPKLNSIPAMMVKNEQIQTEDYTFVTFPVTQDTYQNVKNLEEISKTLSTNTLCVILPNAEYDIPGRDNIKLYWRDNVIYKATLSPIPTQIGHLDDFPSTGAFIKDALDLSSSITLENLIFYATQDIPYKYIDFHSSKHSLKNCYFAGNNLPNQRALTLSRSADATTITVENCLFTSFSYGSEINLPQSKWRKNIFKNNQIGFIGNAGTDLGTITNPGNNLFFNNQYIAEIGSGIGYPMQWGWYYSNGKQLIKLEDILALIKDLRPPQTTTLDSDILIEPFHTTPHPLIPTPIPSNVWLWNHYR